MEDNDRPRHFHSKFSVTHLKFHPTTDIISLCHYNGRIRFFSYEDGTKLKKIYDVRPVKKSCNDLDYSDNGTKFLCAFSDGSITIYDLEKETLVGQYSCEKKNSCNLIRSTNHNIFVTCNECGDIKIWDRRLPKGIIFEHSHPDELVNDAVFHPTKIENLVTVSSNGFLDAYDIKRKKLIDQSDPQSSDLVSLAFYSHKKLLVGCGSADGCVNVFNVGEWGNPVDKISLSIDSSVDYISVLSNSYVLFGTSDGLIKLMSLYPHKTIKQFNCIIKAPLLGMTLSNDERLIAGLFDDNIFFWNINSLENANKYSDQNTIKAKRITKSVISDFYDDL